MSSKIIGVLKPLFSWFAGEYIDDFRSTKDRVYEATVKTNTQINQIILTVSVASLTAVAALNRAVFVPYGILSIIVIALFMLVILLSVINLYISTIVLGEMQKQLNKNLQSLCRLDKDVDRQHFMKAQKILNMLVFYGFCLGVASLLMLLGVYILGLAA